METIVSEVPQKTEQHEITEPSIKRKLLIYLLVSTITFTALVLPHAGVSVPIFVIIQAVMAWYMGLKKKQLMVFLPIFILALNAFTSANPMWRVVNLFVAAALYGVMAFWMVNGISMKDTSSRIFFHVVETIIAAFGRIVVPFGWAAAAKQEKLPLMRRVLIGIALSIPVLIFLVVMLSRADTIFYETVARMFDRIVSLIQPSLVWRILLGIVAGLYLFGIMYNIFAQRRRAIAAVQTVPKGDCVILSVVLSSVLFVYTLFVAIQFRYLFAPPYNLPYGLCFVTYARRGFFELLFLTAVNIAFILVTVWLTKAQDGRGAKLTKFLCMYLCAVTVILLVSSFYRMWLYSSDDGLTRMRTLVFGFLFFELIGLLFTFWYIMKPKFNILLVYALVALSYFLVLNLVPIDRIIARDQVNRYFATGRGGIHYAMSLSTDAAPEIARLRESPNPQTREHVSNYFAGLTDTGGWRQWNLSRGRARRV